MKALPTRLIYRGDTGEFMDGLNHLPSDPASVEAFRVECARRWNACRKMHAALVEALEYAEARADVLDGHDNMPKPNGAMRLASTLQAALGIVPEGS